MVRTGRQYECAYCGEVAAATDDHIPPKALYRQPFSGERPTVKACGRCNEGSSKDDEYFLHTVAKHHQVADQESAKPLVQSMLRAMSKPEKSDYARRTIEALGEADVYTKAGVFAGVQPTIRVQPSFSRAADRYVRGLYRFELGYRPPAELPLRIGCEPESINQVSEQVAAIIRQDPLVQVQSEATLLVEVWADIEDGEEEPDHASLQTHNDLVFES